ncbi:MAG: aldehyde dehydrogenase family protein [Thermoanaerobaculia bacterium]
MSDTRRITYTSTAADPEFRERFDRELARVRERFPLALGGGVGLGPVEGRRLHAVRSPIDQRWTIAEVVVASPHDVDSALGFATAATAGWRALGWERRVALLRAAADRIVARNTELAAWMVYEVGKTRLEAMAEVEESADLLRYYAERMAANAGYRRAMARMHPAESTESVLLPYGVWAVIAPFNFPSALAAGMIGGALVTGNTVVFKPALDAPVSGELLAAALWDAGVPRDALQLVHGEAEVGAQLVNDRRVAGVAFTGSSAVGMSLVRDASREWPRPVVVEMGGKNAAIVTASADLEAAAEGVARSAFGFGGQKCSACSRVYVEAAAAERFTALLVARARSASVGDPSSGDPTLGPVIRARSVEKFRDYVAGIVAGGGKILAGGGVLEEGDLGHGHYVEPTVARLPRGHAYYREEMFLPIVLVEPVAALDEAISCVNAAPYGLTAGLFSNDPRDLRRFLDQVEAGVLYVNRRSGATTGAWPGINPFGGWKGSGAPGPAALGPDYLLKFLREQSRTINGFDEAIAAGATAPVEP